MTVLLPERLDEALAMLAEQPDAVPVAGATDLFVHWPQALDAHDRTYLDLSGIAELSAHHWTDESLVLGAGTTYWGVRRDPRVSEEFPLLVEAARQIGAVQIQTRGTWAGNIVNASPAADGVPVLMAYDAVVRLASTAGTEEVPLAAFYTGYRETVRRPEQLLTAVTLPRRAYDVQFFEKVGSRRAQAITKVGVAVTHSSAGWRVVANSVAPTVRRCRAVEAMLDDERPIPAPDALRAALQQDIAPIDDLRSTAAYRETVLARLLYFGLRDQCAFVT